MVECPIEFRSQKPDTEVDGPSGFGCADFGSGRS